jgi:hypothetical protein
MSLSILLTPYPSTVLPSQTQVLRRRKRPVSQILPQFPQELVNALHKHFIVMDVETPLVI